MKLLRNSLQVLLLTGALVGAWSGQAAGKAEQEVLAKVGEETVTLADLQNAIRSSPYATQFNTLDEEAQAELRGDFLKRLVAYRLLRKEAHARGLDATEAFKKEEQEYRIAQYYRFYTDKLRRQIELPPDREQALRARYKGDADALEAARAAELVARYRELKLLTVRHLRDLLHVTFHEDRIGEGMKADTLLMEGDHGLEITYGDLVEDEQPAGTPAREWVEDRLYKRAELLLFAKQAELEGVDISSQMAAYRQERLPAMLMEQLEKRWAPDDAALKAYYDGHPGLSYVPERWHVGQLVTASYAQAAAMRKRILAGESLFALAGRYSIDPYGRAHNGDMGWIKEGEGNPALEAELKKMADGEVSKVIKSPLGYHLVTVLERRPALKRRFETMKDRVRQAIIQEKFAQYLAELQEKYPVEWKVVADAGGEAKGD